MFRLIILLIFIVSGCGYHKQQSDRPSVKLVNSAETDPLILSREALAQGNFDKFKSYVEASKIDINVQDSQGRTFLIDAVIAKRYSFIEWLVMKKAITTIIDLEDKSAFDYGKGDDIIVSLLNNEMIPEDKLTSLLVLNAINLKNYNLTQWLMEKGANPNEKIKGVTAPMAVARLRTDNEQLLLDLGALLIKYPGIDLSIKSRGKTAKDIALKNGYLKLAELFKLIGQ